MHVLMLLEMAAQGADGRVILGRGPDGLTAHVLLGGACGGAQQIAEAGARTVVFVGENGPGFALGLFAAAAAGVPFFPLNYRLAAAQISAAIRSCESPLVIADRAPDLGGADAAAVVTSHGWAERCLTDPAAVAPAVPDPDDVAVILQTSGTTSAPKQAVLRHRHLTAYVISSVDFMAAAETEATLVSVPPYHVAAVANLLSNVYAGRRLVYLDAFSPDDWIDLVAAEGITHAMVVPTMLQRVVETLRERGSGGPPTLRSLSYGGATMPLPVLERALRLFPDTDFVNAYGLTETSSSIAVLGPEDHRAALASDDPAVRARLGSVGRPLPGVEVTIRDDDGAVVDAGEAGEIWVRGAQVSGEYQGMASGVDADGWLHTADGGLIDAAGYLHVRGRMDDTIIRGGENVAPAEVEDALLCHDDIVDAGVVGVEDEEWGQRIAACVVARPGASLDVEDVRAHVRGLLRGSRTPDEVVVVDQLPRTPTGKILRGQLLELVRGDAVSPTPAGPSAP